MKTKLLFFSAIIFASVLNSQSMTLEEADAQFEALASNTVPITTNLFFFLSGGVFPEAQFKSDELISYGIYVNPIRPSANTNLPYTERYTFVKYWAIPLQQSFDFHLFNDQGREVPKTEKGIVYSQTVYPPTSVRSLDKFKMVVTRQEAINAYPLFRPDEMFVITNKGVYDLKISIKICVPMTNGLPDYRAMKPVPFDPHYSNYNLGIIVSKPLHIKIIKKIEQLNSTRQP